MAQIFPFQPYRYTAEAGPIANLVTQPYDKISHAMRERYLALSPFNLVRIILGKPEPSDCANENAYTRAAAHFKAWIEAGILARDAGPALYAYFQEFNVPDTGERLVRKAFIGLGAVEDYSAGVVHRHEQTLTGPKKDRLELLRHTRAHFGQIFMLYPDPECAVDRVLDEAAAAAPLFSVTDEYGAVHTMWPIREPARIAAIQERMAPRKLLIADGHHRYETALAFRDEHPDLPGARKVMMTFVNMHSPGLRILATHRVLHSLEGFQAEAFLARVQPAFSVRPLESAGALRQAWAEPHPESSRIGFLHRNGLVLLETRRDPRVPDVTVLHEKLLDGALGITPEAVREQRFIRYVRGIDTAIEELRSGRAQAAFLLEPTPVEQVAAISFSGGVMPQKSTDFYPKLLSGLTIYRIGD